jgi:hypothetical protein
MTKIDIPYSWTNPAGKNLSLEVVKVRKFSVLKLPPGMPLLDHLRNAHGTARSAGKSWPLPREMEWLHRILLVDFYCNDII